MNNLKSLLLCVCIIFYSQHETTAMHMYQATMTQDVNATVDNEADPIKEADRILNKDLSTIIENFGVKGSIDSSIISTMATANQGTSNAFAEMLQAVTAAKTKILSISQVFLTTEDKAWEQANLVEDDYSPKDNAPYVKTIMSVLTNAATAIEIAQQCIENSPLLLAIYQKKLTTLYNDIATIAEKTNRIAKKYPLDVLCHHIKKCSEQIGKNINNFEVNATQKLKGEIHCNLHTNLVYILKYIEKIQYLNLNTTRFSRRRYEFHVDSPCQEWDDFTFAQEPLNSFITAVAKTFGLDPEQFGLLFQSMLQPMQESAQIEFSKEADNQIAPSAAQTPQTPINQYRLLQSAFIDRSVEK